jgi:hypothetical protein
LSVNADPATADVLIKDSAKVYVRSLQQRGGLTNMTVQDNGEFHVFDTFAHAAPNLGVATVTGSPSGPGQRTSHMAQNTGSVFNLTLKNNAKMSVDSALDDGTGTTYQGLAMSGGNNAGQFTSSGGESNIIIRDNASFVVQQNLYMSFASSSTPVGANSTLSVRGPDATVEINGDLYMSFDPFVGLENADISTIKAVLTGNTHTSIDVGDLAHIQFGNLAVEFDGYSPVGGESYTLLTANSITGTSFRGTSLPTLSTGLSWDLDIDATTVKLSVLGSLPGLPGDFNHDGIVNAADYVVWRKTDGTQPGYNNWRANFGRSAGSGSGAGAAAVPEPATGLLLVMVAGMILWRRRKLLASQP